MRRYFIVAGDKTTSDGMVLEGEERAKNHGKPLSYHGARVYCPACKSEGLIVGNGPSRPMRLHGKQVALDNDLCICKCNPPPRLIHSQTDAYMSFDGEALEKMEYAPDGRRTTPDSGETFSQHFRFLDDSGRSVSGILVHLTDVDGQTSPVTTDSNGRTPVKSGASEQQIGVSLRKAVSR